MVVVQQSKQNVLGFFFFLILWFVFSYTMTLTFFHSVHFYFQLNLMKDYRPQTFLLLTRSWSRMHGQFKQFIKPTQADGSKMRGRFINMKQAGVRQTASNTNQVNPTDKIERQSKTKWPEITLELSNGMTVFITWTYIQ